MQIKKDRTERFCTEGSTAKKFAKNKSFLTENDSAFCEIVGRDLQCYCITGKDPDEVETHLAADVGKHVVFVGQFYSEHCVREKLPDDSVDLD